MADVPNTRWLNFVDTPAVVAFGPDGSAQVPIDPPAGDVVDVTGFRQVSVLIGSTTANACAVTIGKISGSTLAQQHNFPLDSSTHTFDVNGPQMTLWLFGGKARSREKVQLWVYLRS